MGSPMHVRHEGHAGYRPVKVLTPRARRDGAQAPCHCDGESGPGPSAGPGNHPGSSAESQYRPEDDCPAEEPLATVLIVDDEAMVRAFARRALERAGYNVIEAANGQEAIEMLHKEPAIDAMLLDMTMPQMSGAEAFRQAAQVRPDLRVVLCSGYGQEDLKGHYGGPEPCAFLQKPFAIEDLLSCLASVLDQAGPRRR